MRRLAGLVIAGLLVVACMTPEGVAAAPQVLRVVLSDDWVTAAAVRDVVREFEQDHAGVEVEVTGVAFSQVPAEVAVARDDGRPYDLAQWHAFAAAAQGEAEPLDDAWAAAGLAASSYLPGAVADVSWDGSRYGVPLDVNALVLLANEALLAAAGLGRRDLASLDGVLTAAPALAAVTRRHGLAVTASSWTAYGWIVAGGGHLLETEEMGSPQLDAQGQPTFTFEDPATVAVLDRLAGLVARGEAASALGPRAAADALAAFAAAETALHPTGSWDLPGLRHARDDAADEVTVLPMPQDDADDPRTVLGGSSLYVPRGAERRELAFELALALTGLDVGLQLAAEEGRLPARTAAYDAPELAASGNLAAVVAQLPNAEVMPLIAYPPVAEAFSAALEDILAGRQRAAEAMAEVQAFAEAWVAERRTANR